jgi:arylsulfatase A-like enzyme
VPTLLQAAGQRVVPSVFDGVGLLETLTGGDAPPDRVLYLAPDAALSERWKLVGPALYDLALDPREEKDVSEREPEVVARLKQQLELQR